MGAAKRSRRMTPRQSLTGQEKSSILGPGRNQETYQIHPIGVATPTNPPTFISPGLVEVDMCPFNQECGRDEPEY